MERLLSSTKGTGRDAFSDPSHRMSQRPLVVKSGEGLGFQDIGSSFGPPNHVVGHGNASKNKFKPAYAQPSNQRRAPRDIPQDESDDEILLSSQNSMDGNAISSPKRVVKGKKPDTISNQLEKVRVNGRVLPAHPDYLPSTSNVVKSLRFKKKKDSLACGDVAEVPPQSSSPAKSQDSVYGEIEIHDGDPPHNCPSTSRQRPSSTSSTTRDSSTELRTGARPFPVAKHPSISRSSPPSAKDTPRPRPRPRIVIKRRHDSSPESTPRPVAPKRTFPLRSKLPEISINADRGRTVKKPTIPSLSRRQPQEFPLSLQAKENVSDGSWSSDASSKKGVVSRTTTPVRDPKQIPLPSPLRTKPISRGSTFPDLSPLSSSKDKGKEVLADVDEICLTDSAEKRGGPKPFPMSPPMLANIDIDLHSKSPRVPCPGSGKRASSDDSGTEQGRSAKKLKDSRSKVLDTLDYLQEPMEDDSIELGRARDPSGMCPFCDERLPPRPTPLFQHLLAAARKKSVSDARPRNRGGLKAPLTVYISVCQRHRFESHQLPIATEKGWPKTIDFTKVPARVKKMKSELETIILDKGDVSDVEDLDTDVRHRGPRNRSIFWREVKREVKKQGSRAVVGVKGQFTSFEKAQPGYYGERGSVIIHQTLFDLFPPSTFDASLIAPLAPAEFIQRILVPEAAVRLIMQDLCVDAEDAIVTLRESAQYGVAMFPDTNESKHKGAVEDDEDDIGVADKIVMERARVRRKELAEEEKVEEQMLEEERAAQLAKARESRRERALERAQARRNMVVHAVGDSDVAAQRTITSDAESDAMSVNHSESENTPRKPARQRTAQTNVGTRGNATSRQLPLQIARNRPAASLGDGWSRSMRTCGTNESDSDVSGASRGSRRSVRAQKGGPSAFSWLFSSQSSDD